MKSSFFDNLMHVAFIQTEDGMLLNEQAYSAIRPLLVERKIDLSTKKSVKKSDKVFLEMRLPERKASDEINLEGPSAVGGIIRDQRFTISELFILLVADNEVLASIIETLKFINAEYSDGISNTNYHASKGIEPVFSSDSAKKCTGFKTTCEKGVEVKYAFSSPKRDHADSNAQRINSYVDIFLKVRYENDKIIGFQGILIDVDKRRRAILALEAQERKDGIEDAVGLFSHEMKHVSAALSRKWVGPVNRYFNVISAAELPIIIAEGKAGTIAVHPNYFDVVRDCLGIVTYLPFLQTMSTVMMIWTGSDYLSDFPPEITKAIESKSWAALVEAVNTQVRRAESLMQMTNRIPVTPNEVLDFIQDAKNSTNQIKGPCIAGESDKETDRIVFESSNPGWLAALIRLLFVLIEDGYKHGQANKPMTIKISGLSPTSTEFPPNSPLDDSLTKYPHLWLTTKNTAIRNENKIASPLHTWFRGEKIKKFQLECLIQNSTLPLPVEDALFKSLIEYYEIDEADDNRTFFSRIFLPVAR